MTVRALRLLLTLAIIVVGAATLLGLGYFLVALATGQPLQTTLSVVLDGGHSDSIILNSTGAVVGMLTHDHATLNVHAGGIGYLLAQGFDLAISGGLWIIILWTMRNLVGRIAGGNAFDDIGVRWLRWIGISMVVLNLWTWIRVLVLPLMLLPSIKIADGAWALRPAFALGGDGAGSARIDAQLGIGLLIAGLLMLVLAEAFRLARDIRQENQAFV